jgi:hypothetical protein
VIEYGILEMDRVAWTRIALSLAILDYLDLCSCLSNQRVVQDALPEEFVSKPQCWCDDCLQKMGQRIRHWAHHATAIKQNTHRVGASGSHRDEEGNDYGVGPHC